MLYGKLYFRFNVPVLLFFYSYQELLLYVCLGMKAMHLESATGIVAFILALFLAGYLVFMIVLYLKNVFKFEKSQVSLNLEKEWKFFPYNYK